MSHFSVVVRCSASVLKKDITNTVGDILAPYNEADDAYAVFEDTEDASREKYETEGTEYVRMPDGALLLPGDEAFRVPGILGHEVPPGLERIEVPHREKFSSFEEYMTEWEGSSGRDPEQSRYGCRCNPNAKWDYWRIGGRWRGSLYLKSMAAGFVPLEGGLGEVGYEWKHQDKAPGGPCDVDFCRIKDLDLDRVAIETQQRVAAFWGELARFFKREKFGGFEGPRGAMLDVGMLKYIDVSELVGDEFYIDPWDHERRHCDVVEREPVRAEWQARLEAELNPLRTFAFVDAGGWRDKDEADFMKWLLSGDPEDWVVTVDCHT